MSYETIEKVTLDTFIGQTKIIETLKISVAAAKMRDETLDHILLCGPRGSGKNTIISAVANTLEAKLHFTSCNAIRNASDLATILTGLENGSILVIENFDAIRQDCVELLCTAMEDFCVDIIIGKGTSARSLRLELPAFTLVGVMDTTTNVPRKIQDCFSAYMTLGDYAKEELIQLANKWCVLNSANITDDAVDKIALYANGSNRKLTNILKRARDFAAIINNGVIDVNIADKTINSLEDNGF